VEGSGAEGALPPLPEQARLLHIGLMKTGTTALQRAARERRRQLLQQGVRYPGRHYNHREAALALMRRSERAPGEPPPDDAWQQLLAEVEQDSRRRIWVSNEFICGCDETAAEQFLDDLGPRTHVVVTLRSFVAVLPSLWQQYLKSGTRDDLESWLRVVLADPLDRKQLPRHYARNEQGPVVSRWARLVGPDRLTVVIGDKAHPERVQQAFESMLGLRPQTLAPTQQNGYDSNRSFSAEEAALFLEVNRLLPPGAATEDQLKRILFDGAGRRVLEQRAAPAADTALVLPPWARERAIALGEQYAQVVADSGARIVGDLAELSRPPGQEGRSTMPDQVPLDLAAQALIGALSAGLRRGSDFGAPSPERPRAVPPGQTRPEQAPPKQAQPKQAQLKQAQPQYARPRRAHRTLRRTARRVARVARRLLA